MDRNRKILILDGSRVVRATLHKHLKEAFDIVEEADGESAWQTLMLDARIAAVISGIHPPKLEAHDLLARLRGSSKKHLRDIPFTLIVSDVDDRAEREDDLQRGVAGFITKTMKKSAIVEYLNSLFDSPQGAPAIAGDTPSAEPVPAPGLLDSDQFRALLAALTVGARRREDICALLFGIDNRDELKTRFGDEAAALIDARFAALLLAKVSPPDLIGRCRGERLAIISHGVDLRQGKRFGQQVCKSLATGQITIRGLKARLTVSVGVASTSDDNVTSGGELLALADQRLDQALVCGGNSVVSELRVDCPLQCLVDQFPGLFDKNDAGLPPRIGTLGLRVMPLLRAMDREFELGLPLAEIQQRLARRAESESADA